MTDDAPGPWARVAGLVLLRPHLWATALRQAVRLARPGWWRRPPFVPRPDPGYLGFRTATAYGTGDPTARDVVRYLEWCRHAERARRA